jgi:hypothetical protein
MYDENLAALQVARILRILAKEIENNPELLKNEEFSLSDILKNKKGQKMENNLIDFDIFEIFSRDGKEALLEKLNQLDLNSLKKIVSQHGFDQSKLAIKWRKKEPLINLIIDRVVARSNKGKVFENY